MLKVQSFKFIKLNKVDRSGFSLRNFAVLCESLCIAMPQISPNFIRFWCVLETWSFGGIFFRTKFIVPDLKFFGQA